MDDSVIDAARGVPTLPRDRGFVDATLCHGQAGRRVLVSNKRDPAATFPETDRAPVHLQALDELAPTTR